MHVQSRDIAAFALFKNPLAIRIGKCRAIESGVLI